MRRNRNNIVSGLERPENIMSNYMRAMEEDFGENSEVKSFALL